MRLAVLGSGSGGNASVLQCNGSSILIDAGLSAKQLNTRLEKVGVSADDIDAILLTHEHKDHTRGLDIFLKQRKIPVYTNALTKETLEGGIKNTIIWKIFQTGKDFRFLDISISSFSIPHDAADPVGYILNYQGTKFGVITDTGYTTKNMIEQCKGLRGIFIEANYDEDMLHADTKRPWSIKQRISSRHGHLSNIQTGEFLSSINEDDNLEAVVLGHLSSDCNTGEVAMKTILQHFHSKDASILCATQQEPTAWIEINTLTSEDQSSHTPSKSFIPTTGVQADLFSP